MTRVSICPQSLTIGITLAFLLSASGCDQSGPGESKHGEAEGSVAHAHSVAGETCFMCDASKRDAGRLWCGEHTRYEDRCWLCHPELENKTRMYCKEHFLFEDECFLCHPELKKDSGEAGQNESPGEEKGTTESSRNEKQGGHDHEEPGDGLFCNEHGVMERECGICQPQLAKDLKPGESLKVRFNSAMSASKAGVQTAKARPAETRAGFTAYCEVSYNENRLAHITPLTSGVIRRVLVDVGARVKEGESLVEIHSAAIAEARSAYVSAIVDHRLKEAACKREERLVERKISAEREFQEAEAACKTAELAVKTARQKLVNLGLSEDSIADVEEKQDATAILRVRAPYEGTIVEREAVVGEAAKPGDPLFTLVDLSELWLELSIPADRIAVVEEGLAVEATFADLPGFSAAGRIAWVDTGIDERSRMIHARAVISNAGKKLRVGMFGEARVFVGTGGLALQVPRSSVQRLEGRPYVFVKIEDDLYALRRVLLGASRDRAVQVLQGIDGQEPIVVAGTFTVMSEFLKSRLGAGCVHE